MREQDNNEKMDSRGLTIKQMAVIIGILLCTAVLIWAYNIFRLKEVTVEGLTRYTEEEFKEKLYDGFLTTVTPWFCLTDTVLQKEIPFIEQYEIEYVDKNTARVIVHEKRITGCVVIMENYMYFDKDGIVVESTTEKITGIPVITGLEFQEISLYQKLQVQKESLFDIILQLTRLIEQNGIIVEEISFDSNYEVTLYAGDVIILLGKKTNYDEELNALQGILAVMQSRSGTLDLRNYSKENADVIFKQQ